MSQLSFFVPTAFSRLVGSTLLLFAIASPTLAVTISGTVKAPEGFSAEGARVSATNDQFRVVRTDVGADGTYTLEDLEPGTYTVVAVGKGLETVILKDVVLKEGEDLQRDFTLEAAKPFCIVKSPRPIRMDEFIDDPIWADAPEIRLDQGYQRRPLGSGNLENWGGPSEVSGRFKFKYSDQALHLAADLTFKTPGVEFFFQNDPLDLTREEYDLNHNWQLDIGLGATPKWRLYQRGQGSEPQGNINALVVRKEKASGDGELLRVDMPWSIFPEGGPGKPGIKVPADNALGAMDIVVNANDPDDRENANAKGGLSWSGYDSNWQNPSGLRPIQFCPQAP
jgi:hypothetical protein